jgi:DNA-binding transcriptional ArsR family regulator
VRYFDKYRSEENTMQVPLRGASAVDLAGLFRALADPNRLAIFELVRERGTGVHTVEEAQNSISKIAREFDLSLSTVSHHLKELRTAGLIQCEKHGQTVYCTPVPEALEAIAGFLGESRD